MNPRAPSVAVIGAGAVGLGIGSCLMAAGAELRFVTRGVEQAERLRARGLRRSGIFGAFSSESARAFPQDELERALAPQDERAVDFILVCAKATHTRAIASALAACADALAGPTRVVSCQNGWGNAEILASELGRDRIYNARVITGFRRTGPNDVEITVHAEPVRIGSLFGGSPDAITPLCAAISAGDLPCEPTSEIERDLWAKMLYNCALNPLGALLDVPYGRLGERGETRALMNAVIAEIFAVLGACGYRTHWRDAESYQRHFHEVLLPPTATHESSMLQDLRAGRPTEIDALCGAVARLAASHDVPAPVNQALATLIGAVDQRFA